MSSISDMYVFIYSPLATISTKVNNSLHSRPTCKYGIREGWYVCVIMVFTIREGVLL